MSELNPSVTDIDHLKAFPFLSNKLEDLKKELPSYLAKVDGLSPNIDKLEWWKVHENELPYWSAACQLVLLVQPSSAAAERVFSLLSNSFGDQQTSSYWKKLLKHLLCYNITTGSDSSEVVVFNCHFIISLC